MEKPDGSSLSTVESELTYRTKHGTVTTMDTTRIGQRYQLEKRRAGRPEKRSQRETVSGSTRDRLAEEYDVSQTIMRDAEFARAVETLEDEVQEERMMATTYEQVMQEINGRAATLVQKGGPSVTQADAVRQVLNGDPVLYERYRAASLEPQPLASVAKRAPAPDDSPGAEVMTLAKSLAPGDPFGEGLRQVQRQYPETWARYRQDYA